MRTIRMMQSLVGFHLTALCSVLVGNVAVVAAGSGTLRNFRTVGQLTNNNQQAAAPDQERDLGLYSSYGSGPIQLPAAGDGLDLPANAAEGVPITNGILDTVTVPNPPPLSANQPELNLTNDVGEGILLPVMTHTLPPPPEVNFTNIPNVTVPTPNVTMPGVPNMTMPGVPNMTMPGVPNVTMPEVPVVPLPIVPPTLVNESCAMDVQLHCLAPHGPPTHCNALLTPEFTPCDATPKELIFKFKGGICNSYESPQNATQYLCQDYGAGPALHGTNETNYIEALAPKTLDHLYFAGTVSIGDTIILQDQDGDGFVEEEIVVLVYNDASRVELLQMMVFHTRCTNDDLILGDKYGSLQLVAFTNRDMEATSYKNISYEILVTNVGTDPLHLQHILSIQDSSLKDQHEGGQEVPVLQSGDHQTIVEEMTVDVLHARTISASATIGAHDAYSQSTCAAFNELLMNVPELMETSRSKRRGG